jgi:hypothetical protein
VTVTAFADQQIGLFGGAYQLPAEISADGCGQYEPKKPVEPRPAKYQNQYTVRM